MYRADDVRGGRTMTTEIAGRDRFKFFQHQPIPTIEGETQTTGGQPLPLMYRPIIQRAIPPQGQLNDHSGQSSHMHALSLGAHKNNGMWRGKSSTEKSAVLSLENHSIKNASGGCDAACQTLYRENDCQTEPYTPDYFVEEGQQPEVLSLMELKYRQDRPIGQEELKIIDRIRRRKRVEANLPQGNDDETTAKRLEELEMLERLEWDEREQHIEKLQEVRLGKMERALAVREENREEQSRKRVDALKQSKLQVIEKKLATLQEKKFSVTRKTMKEHTNPCCDKTKRSIIKSHVLYGPRSKPVETSSLVERMKYSNYDVRPTLLSLVEGIEELERSTVPKIDTVHSKTLVPPENEAIRRLPTNYQKRKATEVVNHLEYANELIEKSHQDKIQAASVRDLYRATPRLQRPDTPVLHLQGDDDEEKEEAILLLQRLLRGRAVQNDFYEGKERCRGLIEELQSASNAKDANMEWESEQKKEAFQEKQEAMVQSVVDEAEGDIILDTIDFLFKELRRQQEVYKVHHLRATAEEIRKEREAAETSSRVKEEELNALAEQHYSTVLRAVDNTASSYLTQLFTDTTNRLAETHAIKEEKAKQATRSISDPGTQIEKEILVCNLLDRFVIPEVLKEVTTKKDKVRSRQATSIMSSALSDSRQTL
eukprot:Tbor_TRINITY_DN3703_c0_g1::TRINITY_DN3703_c0_g1_i1::g.2344::m.2344